MTEVIQTLLDNKTTSLRVPGLHDLPINVLLSRNQFATGANDWYGPILTAKELAMLNIINTITDRPDWHRAIFDQQIITQWREDAIISSSLINDKTWDWCLQELQDKARQFDRDGRLVVFNTRSGVCKSDTAISSDLIQQLSVFVGLLSQQAIREKSESAVDNLQLGEVKMPPGRLISFPNAFQHQMGPLQLQDKSKPGHCRFLTLALVDPTYRLCSTWNVPPQQPGWIKGDGAESATQMDMGEALELREELVKEHVKKDEGVFELGSTLSFSGLS